MPGPLDGIRVIEVASWMFIPSGGSVLVDWGAEVIKVEHPIGGDPQRGLTTSGLVPGGPGGVNFMIEQPNRGKRSIGIDIARPAGRDVLLKLCETADVFLTNYLPQVRRKLGIDTDDIRARNPSIIIARGSGQGPKGPDAEKGGYDGASFWARGGVWTGAPRNAEGFPAGQMGPAFGDVMGGLATAGAIAAALLKRERTGEPSVVDVSLLATAMWQVSPMVVASGLYGLESFPAPDRTKPANPGVNTYRTSDDRFISLILLQSDKFWAEFADCLERPELTSDPRFADSTARREHSEACTRILDETFGARPLDHWREALAKFSGVWAPYQTLGDLHRDPQVIANGYLPTIDVGDHHDVRLVASPAQFDEVPVHADASPRARRAHRDVVARFRLFVGRDRGSQGRGRGALTGRPPDPRAGPQRRSTSATQPSRRCRSTTANGDSALTTWSWRSARIPLITSVPSVASRRRVRGRGRSTPARGCWRRSRRTDRRSLERGRSTVDDPADAVRLGVRPVTGTAAGWMSTASHIRRAAPGRDDRQHPGPASDIEHHGIGTQRAEQRPGGQHGRRVVAHPERLARVDPHAPSRCRAARSRSTPARRTSESVTQLGRAWARQLSATDSSTSTSRQLQRARERLGRPGDLRRLLTQRRSRARRE